MIALACTKCNARLSVPDDFAGKRGKCTRCGTVIDVPLRFEKLPPLCAPPDSKACPYCGETIKSVAIICRFCGMNLQTGSSVRSGSVELKKAPLGNNAGPERILWLGHPSHVAFLGYYILGAVIGALGIIGFAASGGAIPLLLAGIGFGGWLISWAVMFRTSCIYKITTRRASEQKGVIGKKYSEVNVEDIRNIVVQYGILEKAFGVGDVGISSAASSGGIEVKFIGVVGPDMVRRITVQAKEDAIGSSTDE